MRVFLIALSMFTAAAFAEPPAQTGSDFEEVVVIGRHYRVTAIEGATKTDTPLIELPQSVQVVTEQLIQDQRPLTISDALRNVSGFSALRNSGEVFRSFNIRGFATLDTSVDGLRQTYGLQSQPDAIANIERIEIIKGPSAALSGRGGLGGTVNLVTKDPRATPRMVLSLSTGSGDLIQPTIDATGPLNASGSIRGRLIADYEQRDTATRFVDVERWQVAPSLSFDVGERTRISFKGDYREREGLRMVAIPAYGTLIGTDDLRLPYDLFIGEPGIGKAHNTGGTGTARIDHQFSDDWYVTAAARYMRNTIELPFNSPTTLEADQRTLNRNYRFFDEVERETALDVFVTGQLNTRALAHTVVAGGDYTDFDFRSQFTIGSIDPINIADPVYGLAVTDVLMLDDTKDGIRGAGVYIQDQINISERLHVLAGVRYDRIEKIRRNLLSGLREVRTDGAVSPRLGFSYMLVPGIAVFGSYSEGLVGVLDGASNASGTPFKSQGGHQWEGGIKLDLLDTVSATLALYDLTRDGVLVTDPAGSGYSIQAGEQKSTGVELDLAWQAVTGLSFIATYTYMDARITRDTTFTVGNQLANDPKHQGRLWGKYAFPAVAWGQFAVAAGITYQGEQQANINNTLAVPDSWVADAGLYWEKGSFGAQLNVINLTDEQYIARGAFGNVGVIPGDPRRVVLTLKTTF